MRVVIASGKGGAGKTCVTASLARVWNRPLVIADTDAEAPNLHLFLPPGITETTTAYLDVPIMRPEACVHCEKCRNICSYKAIASFAGRITLFPDMCHGCGGCFAVCPSGALEHGRRELGTLEKSTVLGGSVRFLMGRTRIGESMTPPLLRREIALLSDMLKEQAADALLDSPPGVSCPAVTVAREADVIVLVVDPTPFGFHDFRLAHQAFAPMRLPVAVVLNRAGSEGNAEGDENVRRYCREQSLPVLAELPFEREAAEQYASGGLLADLSPEWRTRFENLRDALQAFGASTAAEEKVHA